MNPYFRPMALDHLPYNIHHLIICGEYGWQDVYHYVLHSCYSQPDTSYWFQAAFELWRNAAMLVILTTTVLFAFVCMSLAANGIIWLITEGVKYAYNAVSTTLHTPQHITLKNKSQPA
jgi:hypothetical protein